VLEKDMVGALLEEIAIWEQEEAEKGTLKVGSPSVSAQTHTEQEAADDDGRIKLSMVK